MILFEDKDKPETIRINDLVDNKVFNKIHLVFDTNGYNIYNLKQLAPYMYIYADRYIYHKLLKSLSKEKSSKIIPSILGYYNINKNNRTSYMRSYINRLSSVEKNFYKPFMSMMSLCNPLLKFNHYGRIMFNETTAVRSIGALSLLARNIYNWLYDNDCVIKQYGDNMSYMLSIANIKDFKNQLFIFTPKSFLRRAIPRSDYEFMLSLIDKIERNGGYFILIDELTKGTKCNLLLETSAKLYNRKSYVYKYTNTSTMVLTNVI